MESIATGINQTISKFLYIVETSCPECGGDMFAWRSPGRDGKTRCAPACMSCGYKLSNKNKESTVLSAEEVYERSLNSRYTNFYRNGSIVPDKRILDKKLSDYNADTVEKAKGRQIIQLFVERTLAGIGPHAILAGAVGTGKTHLAAAALNKIIEESSNRKNVLFINYRDLLEQIKYSFNDPRVNKELMGNLIPDIKTADAVVIDDLGAELGNFSKKKDQKDNVASDYNVKTITEILDARMDRATIITTNLTSKQIKAFYGDRVFSRMINNADKLTMTFKETGDHRAKGATA